jgi:predicted alpha/beta hydrolase
VLGLTFSDDELLLESGSRMMHAALTGAEVDYRVLSPQQFKLQRIGHFGFFKASAATTLWPLVSDWLDLRCRAIA